VQEAVVAVLCDLLVVDDIAGVIAAAGAAPILMALLRAPADDFMRLAAYALCLLPAAIEQNRVSYACAAITVTGMEPMVTALSSDVPAVHARVARTLQLLSLDAAARKVMVGRGAREELRALLAATEDAVVRGSVSASLRALA
jgi:hypothetical protein